MSNGNYTFDMLPLFHTWKLEIKMHSDVHEPNLRSKLNKCFCYRDTRGGKAHAT